jgi:hypothetical protein
MLERVGHLVGAVGRVDVHQDGADLGRGVLHQRPFGAVGRPHADALAALDAEREERPRALVDARGKLAVGPAHVLVPRDEARQVAVRRERLGQCRDRILSSMVRKSASGGHNGSLRMLHDAIKSYAI